MRELPTGLISAPISQRIQKSNLVHDNEFRSQVLSGFSSMEVQTKVMNRLYQQTSSDWTTESLGSDYIQFLYGSLFTLSQHNELDKCMACINSASYLKLFLTKFMSVSDFMPLQKTCFTDQIDTCRHCIDLLLLSFQHRPAEETSRLSMEQCMRLVRIFSRCDELADDMAGLMKLIADFGQNSPPSLLVEIIAAMANLCGNEKCRNQMLELKVLQSVLAQMVAHRFDRQVQRETGAALSNFTLFNDTSQTLVENGVTDLLLTVVNQNLDEANMNTASQALTTLANLSKFIKTSKSDLDLVTITYNFFKTHFSNDEFALTCCTALGTLALNSYSFSGLETRVTRLILEGLRSKSSYMNYQLSSCFALAHLCNHDCICIPTFRREQGMELLSKAMRLFKFNQTFQTAACFAMGSLLSGSPLVDEANQYGVVDAILSAMTRVYPRSKSDETDKNIGKLVMTLNVGESAGGSDSTSYMADLADENDDEERDDLKADEENVDLKRLGDQSRASPTLPNKLLLRIFAALALCNVCDSSPILKTHVLSHGFIEILHEFSKQLSRFSDLKLVVLSVFVRLTSIQNMCMYTKISMQSVKLRELCAFEIVKQLMNGKIEMKPKRQSSVVDAISAMLSGLLRPPSSSSDASTTLLSETSDPTPILGPEEVVEMIQTRYRYLGEPIQATLIDASAHRCSVCKSLCSPLNMIKKYELQVHVIGRSVYCGFECASLADARLRERQQVVVHQTLPE